MSSFALEATRAPPPRGQPGAPVQASRRWSMLFCAKGALGSFNRDTEKPAMSMEVISGPVTTRHTDTPFASRASMTSFVAIDTSIGMALPRLLTIRATESPRLSVMYLRSFVSSTMILHMSSTSCPTGLLGIVACPGSPWMPRPISICPSLIRVDTGRPGMWHTEALTPTDPTDAAAPRASSTTASRPRPASAAAPAILCTNTVPAMPRRPVTPLERSIAQSSATTTIVTGIPSALAFSAAMVKLMRSPV
mmetsp:Transcript_21879/g.42493  ORF Transcript_21879/g.42493 Transcript_21879/m.42493 type:complete len:250 (-) Transcript_21879:535-1284(-)